MHTSFFPIFFLRVSHDSCLFFFFFNDPPTPEFSPLPLPDALRIYTRHQPGYPVVEQDDPDGVEQQRDPEGHGEEDRFAGDEDHQLPALQARERLVADATADRSEEHTSELQSQSNLVCRLLLEKKKQ